MNKIIVTSKKVEEIKKFVRNLLDQKAYIDTRIREYQANVIDLYKVVLLEDYISGIQIMLRSIGIKYSLDDKQLVFDIDFTNLEQEYENPHNDIKTVFVELRKIIKDLMDKYDEPKNEEGQLEYEKKVVRNFYCLLGATTIANKLGIKFCTQFLDKDNEKENFIQQLFMADEEVEDYITMTNALNNITDHAFDKINLKESIKCLTWKRKITTNENLISSEIFKETSTVNPEIVADKIKGLEVLQNNLIEENAKFEELLVDLTEKIILINANFRSEIYTFFNDYIIVN